MITIEETEHGVERRCGGSNTADFPTRAQQLCNDEFRREDVCGVGKDIRYPGWSRQHNEDAAQVDDNLHRSSRCSRIAFKPASTSIFGLATLSSHSTKERPMGCNADCNSSRASAWTDRPRARARKRSVCRNVADKYVHRVIAFHDITGESSMGECDLVMIACDTASFDHQRVIITVDVMPIGYRSGWDASVSHQRFET